MDPIILIISVVILLILAGLMGIIYFNSRKRNSIRERVLDFVIEQESRISPSLLNEEGPGRELEGSLIQRTIISWINQFVSFIGRFMPTQANQELSRKLSMIGSPGGMRAIHFNVLRLMLGVLGFFIMLLVLIFSESLTPRIFLSAVSIPLIMVMFPTVLLNSRVRAAQNEIRKNLPDALDMLSVCSSAGLGFDQSLQKVSDYWQTALGTEFRRVVQEIEIGLTRSQALRNMAERLQVAELSSFVAVLVQAEQLGMQIADVLHSQAEQMRILRQFRAKEIANKLPARMMLPLATCILPALIAVILGPMIPQFLQALNVL